MSTFFEKLKRLPSAGPPPVDFEGKEKAERIARMRRALDAIVARDRARPRPVAAEPWEWPGEIHAHPAGEVRIIDRYLEPHHHHGQVPVRDALSVCGEVVAQLALDHSLKDVDFRKALLIDTETTGLSGGTGTIPFLIGMAYFDEGCLRVQQLFLPRLGEELPMLSALSDRLREASCLVSYNGKSFDWPLLRTRFVMNRLPMPSSPPHLDLLHCARRIYKRRFSRMRLVDMEREVLAFHREDDVDGSEIPKIYFDFINTGDGSRIASVVDHNYNDLVALAALLSQLAGSFAELQAADDPRDHLSYAEVAFRAGDEMRAREFVNAAIVGGGDAVCTTDARQLAAKLARRRRDLEGERQHLEGALLVADVEARPAIHLLLAKFYEHRARDLNAAIEHAQLGASAEESLVNERRIKRLRARLQRSRESD